MNNEYNDNNQPNEYRNQSNEYRNANQYPYNNKEDNNLNQSNQQQDDNRNYAGNYYSYGSTSQSDVQIQETNVVSYSPPLNEGKKPKKKRKGFEVLKFTAAAVAFGLIAAIAFQGYYLVTNPTTTETKVYNNDESKINVAKITEDTKSGDTIVPAITSTDAIITDVSEVVANVMPSIVAINSSATGYDIFGRKNNTPTRGSGSGIIIGQNGSEILIVTNNHVIEGAETVEIVFTDETTANAIVKGAEPSTDLAVLSVEINKLSKETAATIKVATLGDSDEVKAGEMAIAIGNALGYGQSVTVGYISAVNRDVTIDKLTMTLLQTDAAINPGNSGGALINTQGQIIGINSVKFASEAVEGMGYAIPITDAIPMINELMSREVVEKGKQGFLGIDISTAQNVTLLYAQRFNMPLGVYINDVVSGSPAEDAGLRQGDIITGLNETKVETIEALIKILTYKKAGETIDLIIQVKEQGAYIEKTLVITLGQR